MSDDQSDISTELDALQPDERAVKAQKFREHFKEIEAALARGATKTKVLRVLAQGSLSLSVNTFNKMLNAERARRSLLQQSDETPGDNLTGSSLKPEGSQ